MRPDEKRFRGKKVLLTGGSGGLGGLISTQLLKAGADLTIVDRAPPPQTEAHHLPADLSSAEGIEALCTQVAATDWDVLINLAGIQHFGRAEDETPAHTHATYMVNLVAPVRLSQAVLPRMKMRNEGQIANIGSIFGSINFAHFVTYSSSKSGLRAFSQALRRELVGSDIAVTYIAPRAVKTALNSPTVMEFAAITKMNMDDPAKVSRRIVRAIRQRKRDVFFGFPESLFVRVNGWAPSIVDGALAQNDRKAAELLAA
jgi:short-subunit dehydrogenase